MFLQAKGGNWGGGGGGGGEEQREKGAERAKGGRHALLSCDDSGLAPASEALQV